MTEIIPKSDGLDIEVDGRLIVITQDTEDDRAFVMFHHKFLRAVIDELEDIEREFAEGAE